MAAAKLLLDTHIALWLANGDARLRPSTLDLIEDTRRAGGTIYLSAVSAWEMALLLDTGRLRLNLPPTAWLERFLALPGMAALPLAPAAAACAYDFHPFPSRDPADRLIMASAVEYGCTLLTYDAQIRSFARRYGGQYRLQVSG
ncbi:MAG: type II toxin-antitoxin system VapC family toxin [Terriglobales bacterium]